MKNLIKIGIDKLLEMDFPIEKINRWNNRSCNHKVYDYYPYEIAYRIAKTFIDKPFNDAYSYFCKKVPIYQQREFFDIFDHRYRRSKPYSIDDEGIIRYTEENRPKTVSIKSPDYRVEYVHKVNNMNKQLFKKVSRTFCTYYIYSGTRYSPLCIATDSDFKPVVVSGYIQEFSSKNDYRYKRHNAEQTKKRRLEYKERKRRNAEIAYCMMTKDEIKLKELGALDELKILSHRFVADWNNGKQCKYVICIKQNNIETSMYSFAHTVLHFVSSETRDLFLETHRELIETAKEFI